MFFFQSSEWGSVDAIRTIRFHFLPRTSIQPKTHSKKSASAAVPELETRDRCSPASVTAAARAEAAAASRRALVAAEGGIVEFFCEEQFFFIFSYFSLSLRSFSLSLSLSFYSLSLSLLPTSLSPYKKKRI